MFTLQKFYVINHFNFRDHKLSPVFILFVFYYFILFSFDQRIQGASLFNFLKPLYQLLPIVLLFGNWFHGNSLTFIIKNLFLLFFPFLVVVYLFAEADIHTLVQTALKCMTALSWPVSVGI